MHMTIYSCQENIAKLWTWRSFRTPHFGKHYHFSFDLITGVTPSYRHQAGNTDYRNFIKNNLQFIKWETFTLYLIRIQDENTIDNDIGNLMVGGLFYTLPSIPGLTLWFVLILHSSHKILCERHVANKYVWINNSYLSN